VKQNFGRVPYLVIYCTLTRFTDITTVPTEICPTSKPRCYVAMLAKNGCFQYKYSIKMTYRFTVMYSETCSKQNLDVMEAYLSLAQNLCCSEALT
jgi:hypothetical protein